MLITDIIRSQRQVLVYLEISTQIVTGLDKAIPPIWLSCKMHAYWRFRDMIIHLETVSNSIGELISLDMLTELHPVSERKSEIRYLPVK